MREEWNAKIKKLEEEVDIVMHTNVDGPEQDVLSHGLKLLHKDSGLRYTIDSVGPRDVILLTPEGEKFLVDKAALESEYELD